MGSQESDTVEQLNHYQYVLGTGLAVDRDTTFVY